LILGGEEVVEGFPTARSAGNYPSTYVTQDNNAVYGKGVGNVQGQLYSDSGSASRFFFNFSEQEADE
jgi:hypothetical protein